MRNLDRVPWRRLAPFAVAAAVVLLGVVMLLRTAPARAWLFDATGEESLWEGTKGAVALALLEVTGPELDLAPDAPVEHLGVSPYGVNVFLQLEPDPAVVRRSFELLSGAGVRWARQEFPWEDIEIHERGDFEDRRHEPYRSAWDKYDNIVQEARAHGVELLVRLSNPPAWAYADEDDAVLPGPPDELVDFGNYVAAVVERYCGQVRYYQIWNEPNIYPEWGEQDVDPAGYAELLSLAARRARAACDDVVVVSAGLAPNTEAGGRNMDDLAYLEALYELGWQDDFDILAAQAFGLWTGPTDRRVSRDRANFSRPMLVRDVMVRHGDGHKPVWFTEMGWASPPLETDASGCEPTPITALYGRVAEDRRAEYTRLAYRRMAEEWPWAGVGFLWFFRRPNWEWHCAPEGYGYFRIVDPDFGLTPAFDALAQIAAEPPVLRRGRRAPTDPALRATGPWRGPSPATLGSRVGTKNAELVFTFAGTDFEIRLLPPSREALIPEVFLVVDGSSETVSPTEDTEASRLVLAQEGLDDGAHQVIVRVESGELWLEEVRVSAPGPRSPWAPLARPAVVAALAALVALVAAVGWRRRSATPPAA